MSSFLKIFDSAKESTNSTNNNIDKKTETKAKKHKQKNGIYRTINVSKSSSDIYLTQNIKDKNLKIYKTSYNKEYSDDEDYIDMSKKFKKNSDIVFYKRKIPSHYDSDDELRNKDNDDEDDDEEDDEDEDDEGILVDVLPSFQFYDSLVKFLPEDKDEDLDNCDIEDNILLSPLAVGEDNIIGETEDSFNPPEYETNEPRPSLSSPPGSSEQIDGQNSEEPLRYEVDDIHNLSQKIFKGVDINIVLTKTAVKPNTPLEKESALREFSSGELINGYFTITNRTSAPIRFEGFYVSFEGIAIVRDGKSHRSSKMRFLKTHDLSATWSYSHVEIASGVGYAAGSVDKTDNSRLGLPNNKILKPKVKYKKYFCFKIPTEILDMNCKHQIPNHLGLPPSFGLNRLQKENATIKCNDVLGYGNNGMRGSAILCPDLDSYDSNVSHELKKHLSVNAYNSKKLKQGFKNEGSSISYSVNCRLVMKDEKNLKPYILNDTAYHIRIVPNTLTSNNKFKYTEGKHSAVDDRILKKKLLNLNENIIKRTDQLETLLQKLEHWESDDTFSKTDLTIQTQDIVEKKQEQELKDSKLSWKALGLQRDNLNANDGKNISSNDIIEHRDIFRTFIAYNYDPKKKSSSSLDMFNNFFVSHNNNHLPSNSLFANGEIMVETKLNKDLKALPYYRTPTIEHYNTLDKKNNFNKKLWTNYVYPQLPVKRDDYLLDSLDLKIKLKSNNLEKVPKLKSINTFLKSFTTYTEKELPFLLDSNFIIKEKKFLKQVCTNSKAHVNKVLDLKEKYALHKDRLANLAKKLNVDTPLVRFEAFIGGLMYSDLISLSNLEIEEFEITNIFETTDIISFKWKQVGDSLESNINVNLKYKENLLMCILPTFDNCLISRFYHLQIECEFDTGDKAILKIPIDVKYF
ncbi:hypothetical protein HANVADRAFT_62516 [Hanseniaspora valbyensis NRRL Y-1626]|uniref:Bul1 N-terminal domain-containing protein n=1 Tax=Hanseniaspora valbyensis NRRL Y-1626 TaxID=766949 RepID=A0A1B7TDF3_9ASCO|nr:hypothetical protein HANVADRAFT_62516 [Hanseniaspora valbyensis NRRL Y-1626]